MQVIIHNFENVQYVTANFFVDILGNEVINNWLI